MHGCADRSLGEEEMDHQLVVSIVSQSGLDSKECGEERGQGIRDEERTWVPSNIV
jgi:hypothetical protein